MCPPPPPHAHTHAHADTGNGDAFDDADALVAAHLASVAHVNDDAVEKRAATFELAVQDAGMDHGTQAVVRHLCKSCQSKTSNENGVNMQFKSMTRSFELLGQGLASTSHICDVAPLCLDMAFLSSCGGKGVLRCGGAQQGRQGHLQPHPLALCGGAQQVRACRQPRSLLSCDGDPSFTPHCISRPRPRLESMMNDNDDCVRRPTLLPCELLTAKCLQALPTQWLWSASPLDRTANKSRPTDG